MLSLVYRSNKSIQYVIEQVDKIVARHPIPRFDGIQFRLQNADFTTKCYDMHGDAKF